MMLQNYLKKKKNYENVKNIFKLHIEVSHDLNNQFQKLQSYCMCACAYDFTKILIQFDLNVNFLYLSQCLVI